MTEENSAPARPPRAPAGKDRNVAPSLWSRTRSVVGWVRDRWKLLTAAYVFLLFFWPAFYLANVNVDIRDAKGASILQVTCDSPLLLVEVPKSGTYRIRAETAGYRLDRVAKVRASRTPPPWTRASPA